jgi:hypothetical protein
MWRRLSLAFGAAALVLTLGVSSSLAVTAQDTFGSASVVGGNAFVRIMPDGSTHVQVRATGLTPGSQPVFQITQGSSSCSATYTVLIGPSPLATTSSLGISMTATTSPVVLPVSAGVINFLAIRLYESVGPTGVLGPGLGCSQIISVPDNGTQHWW